MLKGRLKFSLQVGTSDYYIEVLPGTLLLDVLTAKLAENVLIKMYIFTITGGYKLLAGRLNYAPNRRKRLVMLINFNFIPAGLGTAWSESSSG